MGNSYKFSGLIRLSLIVTILVIVCMVAVLLPEKVFGATSLSGAKVVLSQSKYTYNGSSREPDVEVYLNGRELSRWYDYECQYKNNKNAGIAKVIVKGDGYNYTGSVTKKFRIKKKKLTKRWFWLNNTYFVYNGRVKKISGYFYFNSSGLTRKMKRGRDIKVSSRKLKKVGKYRVTVRGRGNFTGKLKFNVVIKPKDPKGIKLTKRYKNSFGIKWKKVKGATGYIVEYTNRKDRNVRKNLRKRRKFKVPVGRDYEGSVTVYSYKKVRGRIIKSWGRYYSNGIRPKGRPKFSKQSNYGSFSIKMKRDGSYELWVATNKHFTENFRPFTFYAVKGDGITINCCGEHYRYIRVRQYITTPNGSKLYGKWSKRKKVIFY